MKARQSPDQADTGHVRLGVSSFKKTRVPSRGRLSGAGNLHHVQEQMLVAEGLRLGHGPATIGPQRMV